MLEVHDLVKRYPGADAVNGISLILQRGTVLGLLGPNGSGKSTLLKTVAGLVHPDSGEIRVEGLPVGTATKARVAYLPEVDPFHRWMRVGQVLDLVGAFYGDWDPARAQELLHFMNLTPDAKVGSLSKGMRARLRLVVTLARNAPLLLLDEPLSGIDVASRARIIQGLIRQYRGGEQTLVVSTHEVGEVEGILERVVFLETGRIRLEGEADALRDEHGGSLQQIFEEVFA
ncbi:ABC transporter [Limnochorda pilosa]|uniref:ABC transporter n=1 Tax=Limnochorda pilosa TaxID=1555112 RepID=A0A0K2SH04_LIMPI|nr:ABC transporter [Limnochorda pilosa]